MKKAALHNLGCKVNAYETEAMQQLLEQAGYEIVPFTERADVYVINTCSVTNMADRKSRQMLHKAKKKIRTVSLSLPAVMSRLRRKKQQGIYPWISLSEMTRNMNWWSLLKTV